MSFFFSFLWRLKNVAGDEWLLAEKFVILHIRNMKQILPIIIILTLLLTAVCLFKGCDGNNAASAPGVIAEVGGSSAQSSGDDEKVRKSTFVGSYARVFNDKPDAHMAAADRYGITPIMTLSDAWNLRQPIERISSCPDFEVDELTHSYPYLVPDAARLLHAIGSAFRDSLKHRGYAEYRPIVTSVLRTQESVRRLSRRNVNAVSNSAHLYGTTFDITHAKYSQIGTDGSECHPAELKRILAEVLVDLRDRKQCLVKYERKQPCFHITVCH